MNTIDAVYARRAVKHFDPEHEMSDAEMMDSIDYTVFPNMHPWGAFNRITYRFRPNGDDHRSSIMEVFFLSPFTGERPPPAKERKLGVDEHAGKQPVRVDM